MLCSWLRIRISLSFYPTVSLALLDLENASKRLVYHLKRKRYTKNCLLEVLVGTDGRYLRRYDGLK